MPSEPHRTSGVRCVSRFATFSAITSSFVGARFSSAASAGRSGRADACAEAAASPAARTAPRRILRRICLSSAEAAV